MVLPDRALALSYDGVTLRQRRGTGWQALDTVVFDAPDSRTALDRLRARAGGGVGEQVPVLLVLPRDQVLYGRLRRPRGDSAAAVRAALAEQTALPPDALRFAFTALEDGSIAFAAAALETMCEAESFAREHGFAPRGVLAPPRSGLFEGAAWFGATRQAAPEGWVEAPDGADWAVTRAKTVPAMRSLADAAHTAQTQIARALGHAKASRPLKSLWLRAAALRLPALGAAASLRLGRKAAVLGGATLSAGLLAFALQFPGSRTAPHTATAPTDEGPTGAIASTAQPGEEAPEAGLLDADETDLWTPERALMRPAVIAGLDALVQPSLDPPLGADALALDPPPPNTLLPDMAGRDAAPSPETRYDLDPDGLVRPTPEGAETPQGVRVFAGPPPRAARPRPLDLQDAYAAAGARAEATPPPVQDGATAAASPRPRPGDLVDRHERGVLGGRTRVELASLRPAPRSAERAAAAAAARAREAAALEAAIASAQAGQTRAEPQSAAPPAQRPAAAEPSTAPAALAPAPADTSPVIKQASSDRIDLRDINLLGTFGPTSEQRALVRLPSGRVVNLSVGDRFDGGRISAIDRGEVRYTKDGRPYILRMPRG